MPVWEQLLLGIGVLIIILIFFPRAGKALKNSPKGKAGDWLSVGIPIGLVVLFVLFLIMSVR